jgi:hypothetical protein
MKIPCKDFGSTANQSEIRKFDRSPAPENVPKRRATEIGGSRLQSLRSASKVREVSDESPRPQEIQVTTGETLTESTNQYQGFATRNNAYDIRVSQRQRTVP